MRKEYLYKENPNKCPKCGTTQIGAHYDGHPKYMCFNRNCKNIWIIKLTPEKLFLNIKLQYRDYDKTKLDYFIDDMKQKFNLTNEEFLPIYNKIVFE